MHLVVGAERCVSISARVKNSGAPCGPSVTASSQRRDSTGRSSAGTARADPGRGPRPAASRSPRPQRRPGAAAEMSERESRGAAEIFGNVDASGHQDVAAHPGTSNIADVHHAARRNPDRPPLGTGTPSTVTAAGAPVTHSHPAAANRNAGPANVHSSPGAPSGIAEGPIPQPERQIVHRPRRRHSHMPVAHPSRANPAPSSAFPAAAPPDRAALPPPRNPQTARLPQRAKPPQPEATQPTPIRPGEPRGSPDRPPNPQGCGGSNHSNPPVPPMPQRDRQLPLPTRPSRQARARPPKLSASRWRQRPYPVRTAPQRFPACRQPARSSQPVRRTGGGAC